uniref:Putative nucleic acid-binding protein n=1 Tax=Lutzomyia longipalpis TaxID=7200 RepID=A0A1B0FUY7_LUTLO
MADTDFSKMKVADLKRELKNRGLSTAGNKNELQERLQMALLDSDPVLEDSTIISGDLDDDEVLNDEELENAKDLLEETSHEDAILASPTPSAESAAGVTTNKSPGEAPKEETQPPARKIVLKRKMIVIPPPEETSQKDSTNSVPEPGEVTSEKSDDASSVGECEKKVIKLSEMSAKERLELRMKKFGAPQTPDAKKLARAERFGSAATTPSASNGSSGASIDVLKKRAERFGGSVSTTMTKMENQEKLKKRQERFGASTVAGKISVSPTVKSEYESKAQQRLERFKTS